MDDKHTRPAETTRVSARTSERVAKMSDDKRAELARDLAGRTNTVSDARIRRAASIPHEPGRQGTENADAAAAAVRLAADLRGTERRLDRLERSFTPSRYQTTRGGAPTGRYARLLRRADQIERQLRALR